MPTLHLLPGESQGDTAEIVLTSEALHLLIRMLEDARDGNDYACGRFRQRDEGEYTVCVDVVDKPHGHPDWTGRPMAYLRHQIRHVRYDSRKRPYDADLLASHLYAARKARRHCQLQAAAEIGVSIGFVSHVENVKTAPHERNFERVCAYIGTHPADYSLEP